MKKLLLLAIATLLFSLITACTGHIDLDPQIPTEAKQLYIDSGATVIHLIQQGVTTPVTVTAAAAGKYLSVPSACGGGTFNFPISQSIAAGDSFDGLDPVNGAYWLTQPITVTYELTNFDCSQTDAVTGQQLSPRCGCTADANNPARCAAPIQNGSIWEVGFVCTMVVPPVAGQ